MTTKNVIPIITRYSAPAISIYRGDISARQNQEGKNPGFIYACMQEPARFCRMPDTYFDEMGLIPAEVLPGRIFLCNDSYCSGYRVAGSI